jgi:peptidoglycan/xylan/chitin deacetylase (PgdA/CDA1 family)
MTSPISRNAREATKELAARILCAAGVPALARSRMRGRLAILMFHGVEAEPLSPPCDYVIDRASLRRDLEYLRRHFNVLPLEEALERLADGRLPASAVALTFDDGTRNLAMQAAPVLRELGLPAAVFLATGPMGTDEALWPDRLWLAFARTNMPEVDLTALGLGTRSLGSAADRGQTFKAAVARLKDLPDAERIARVESLVGMLGQELDVDPGPFRLLSWDEARAIASDGLITLYPHTVTHPILSRCPDEKVADEVSGSCVALERETGCAPAVFAYPNGRAQDFDERARAALRRNGVRWALSTTTGFAQRGSDPLALPRIGIGGDDSFALYRLRVSGFKRPWRRFRASRPAADVGLRREMIGTAAGRGRS